MENCTRVSRSTATAKREQFFYANFATHPSHTRVSRSARHCDVMESGE